MNYKSLFIGVIAFMGVAASCYAGEKGKYGDADTNNKELRVPKSVKPAFDYWGCETHG